MQNGRIIFQALLTLLKKPLILSWKLEVEDGGDGIFFPGSDDELGFIEDDVIDDDGDGDDGETKYEVHML